MENDNLLKRCETFEADFNTLDTYIEKRDFVIQIDKVLKNDLEAKSLFNEFRKFNESNPPYTLNPKHNSSAVNEFSSKLEGDRKIKFDAFYKAIELLEIEFKKIEPKLILEIAVKIIIKIHKDDFDNDYKELRKFANLLIKSPHHAHDKFFNNRIDLIYCRDSQMEIYKDYLFEPHVSICDGYIDFFIFSIRNNTFFKHYKIDNNALAAKLKEYINTILNDVPTPPIITKPSTVLKKIDKLSGEIRELKEVQQKQNKKAILIPTTKTPKVENNKPYKPHIYEPCTVIKTIKAKVTYLEVIGELDKLIELYKVDNKLPKLVDVLEILKELNFKDKDDNKVVVFDALIFDDKPNDNKAITQYIRAYLNYKVTGKKENWFVDENSKHKVKIKLKNPKYKEFEMLFNSKLLQ